MTTTTDYKGFKIVFESNGVRIDSGRYYVDTGGIGGLEFNSSGYATLNNAKGAVTKCLTARGKLHRDDFSSPKAAAATSDDAARASVPVQTPLVSADSEARIAGMVEAMQQSDSDKWTTQRTPNGDPIHANPRMAHVYAELDYYGMTRAHDKRSRNKREGVYNGYTNGHHERAACRNGGSRALFSRTSGHYAPIRKARKAAKLNARKGA